MTEDQIENPDEGTSVTGIGKFFFPNGGLYDGEYKEIAVEGEAEEEEAEEAEDVDKPEPIRKRQGNGTYSEHNNVYEGQWEDDMMQGEGKFTYASGAVYEGGWVQNKYSGSGKYQLPDGSSYEGTWEENVLHGEGIYTDAQGHRFKGHFFNGKGSNLTKLL